MPARRRILVLFAVIATLLAACGSPATSGAPAGTPAPTGPSATAAASATPAADAAPLQSDDPTLGTPPPTTVLPDPETGDIPPEETTPVLAGNLSIGAPGAPVTTAVAGETEILAGALSMTLAAGALPDGTSVEVTASKVDAVTGDAWGGAIAPVSDLYTVTGAETLGEPATVRVTLPAGTPSDATHIPMLVYYDPATGGLSPLAPLAPDPATDGVVVGLAPHFSSLLAVVVDTTRMPAVTDSGFRPGKDDWEFTNYGSYAAPGGHCEGQSVTAIWYYATQRRGAGASPLYGLYDNNGAPDKTQQLWQDDSHGYRLASTVQHDPISDNAVYTATKKAGRADSRLAAAALRTAIAASGAPQLFLIADKDGGHGHAIVAYRVTGDRIFVADPNYPGRLRTIRIAADGTLSPYISGDNATAIVAGKSVTYVQFAYVPAAASASDASIAGRWAEFEAGTIGSATFPTELISVKEAAADGTLAWSPLVDGYAAPTETITLGLGPLSDGAASRMRVYAGASETPLGDWGWKHEVTLAPGDNPLGFEIFGLVGGKWKYVDFVRLTVRFGEPEASPTEAPTAATSTEAMPVVTSFTGPTTFAYAKGAKQTFTIKMRGGTAPYHYTWSGRGTPIGEADGPATFTFTISDDQVSAASNGAGYYISMYITDAAGNGARWVDASGRKSSEFIYAIEGLTGMPQQAVLYPPIPYQTPAP